MQATTTTTTMRVKESQPKAGLPRHPVARLVGHEGPIQDVCFTADGKYCLTAGHDRTVRLWNPSRIDPAFPPSAARSMRTEQDLPPALPVQCYADGHTHPVSAIAVDHAIDADAADTNATTNTNATTLLSASDKALVVTDLVTQKVKRRFQGYHHGRINSVFCCTSNRGNNETFLSGSYDSNVCIFDGRNRNPKPLQILHDAKDSITDVQIDRPPPPPYGNAANDLHKNEIGSGGAGGGPMAFIRTSSVDGIVRTYDIRSGLMHCDEMGCPIVSFASSKDRRCLASSGLDGSIRLMESSSGELLNTYEGCHVARQYAVKCRVTSDDAHVVTGSEDGNIVYYDMVTGQVAQCLAGHDRPTCAIAVHPRRHHAGVVVSGSYDGNAVVWAPDASYVA